MCFFDVQKRKKHLRIRVRFYEQGILELISAARMDEDPEVIPRDLETRILLTYANFRWEKTAKKVEIVGSSVNRCVCTWT